MREDLFIAFWSQMAFEPSMILQNISIAAGIPIALYVSEKKKLWRTVLVHAVLLYFAMNLAESLTLSLTGQFIAAKYAAFGLAVGVYAVFVSKLKKSVRIIISFSLFAMGNVCSQLGGTIPRLMADLPYGGIIEIFIRNGFVLLLILFAVFLRRFNTDRFPEMSSASVYCVVSYSISSVVLALLHSFYYDIYGYETALFVCVAYLTLGLVSIIAYYMFYRNAVYNSRNLLLQAEVQEIEHHKFMLRMSEENLQEMRRLRHEMNNQYSYMKMMLQNQQYEELASFFDAVNDTVIEPLSVIDCGNPKVSAVLNMELSKARAFEIQLDVKAAVPPSLPFKDTEVCSLLTNLLDNSIEACVLHQIENAVVEVRIRPFQNYFCIHVANPIGEDVDIEKLRSLKTSKKNARFHGYGSQIIDSIVEKYEGSINRSVQDGKFIAEIMMNMADSEQ